MLKTSLPPESVEAIVAAVLASTCRQQAFGNLSRINNAEFTPTVVAKLRYYLDALQWLPDDLPGYARMLIRQISVRAIK
jgi:hypothetical protein